MLLLILFAGCLASCAAQTTSPSPSLSTVPGGIPPLIMLNTASLPPLESTDNGTVLAYLVTTVKSYIELNEATIAPVMDQLKRIIQQRLPDVEFIVTVKNIDKV